jgi:hypothetical protein
VGVLVVRWQSSETDLPPAPRSPLVVEVDCSTGTRVTGRHEVRLDADWTLTTPHDLDAERVLAALGGSMSCLQLQDVVVPTLRSLVQLSGRHRLAGVSRTGTKRWRWRVTSGSCRRCEARSFPSLSDAVRHERTLTHWTESPAMTAAGPLARASLCELYDAAGRARLATATYDPPPDHRHVLEAAGMSELRGVGIPEDFVDHVHDVVWPDGPALPSRLYVAAAYLLPDLDWLAAVARERPDVDVVTWAAWSETPLDRNRPRARLQWLSLGVSTRDTALLMNAGYTPDEVAAYATVAGLSAARAASVVAAWDAVGCKPGPSDLVALERIVGAPWQPPAGGAIDLLLDASRGLRPAPTRTQAALVLAAVGTRPHALAVLRAGARDPEGAHRCMEQIAVP